MKGIKVYKHDQIFKPVKTIQKGMRTPYVHVKEYDFIKKKSKRDENGKVIIEPSNILTNPSKVGHFNSTVGHTFGANPKFLKDPYDLAKRIKRVEFYLYILTFQRF